MYSKKNAITLLILSLSAGKLWALPETYQSFEIPNSVNSSYLELSGGMISGQANEYVYEGDRKVSELNWKYSSTPILKAELSYYFLPRLSLNLKGWSTLDKNKAVMDDYDWLNPAQAKWTHWSHHTNTNVQANNFDVGLTAWLLSNTDYKFGITAGYEKTSFDFMARDGYLEYDDGKHIESISGNIPGVSYAQTFDTPYIGLSGNYLITKRVELKAGVKYSGYVNTMATDNHFQRQILFIDTARTQLISTTLGAGYYLNNNFQVFADATYNNFANARANTIVVSPVFRETYSFPKAGGLANQYYGFSVGLKYKP